MSEQRASLHVIIFLGLAGVAMIMVLMMMGMDTLQQSPAGTRAKIANAVIEQYKFKNAVAEYKDGPKHKILHVTYITDAYLKADDRHKELVDLAKFVYEQSLKHEDPVLYSVEEVQVVRREERGSGCFQSRSESTHSLPLPRRVPKESPNKRPVDRPN